MLTALDRVLLSVPRQTVDQLAMGLTAAATLFIGLLLVLLLLAINRQRNEQIATPPAATEHITSEEARDVR